MLYDAAHAFGVKVNGESVLKAGDMSTLSFHATKVYNTIEGGALVVRDEQTKKRIDYLKNFGFANEVTVVGPGINSKMDEVRAAYGLLNLKQVDQCIEARGRADAFYREALKVFQASRCWNRHLIRATISVISRSLSMKNSMACHETRCISR